MKTLAKTTNKVSPKTLKSLREALQNCKQHLRESQLDNMSFEDFIAPEKEALRNLRAAVAEAGLVSLDAEALEQDKIDIQKVLSVSEVDTDPNTGVLSEDYYKKSSSLLRLVERSRSYQEIVTDFKKQVGRDDFAAFQEWGKSQEDANKCQVVRERNFHVMYQLAGDVQPELPAEMLEPSQELKDLIDWAEAGEDIVETATDTVTTKYELVELKLRRVIRGKSVKRYYLLAGDAGIGKTYIVNQLVKEAGMELDESGGVGSDTRVPVVTGSIGRNPTTVAEFLWKYRDTPLVVMDDCDTFLRVDANPDVTNILKGAMEPGTNFHVHITSSIAKMLTKMFKRNEAAEKRAKALQEGELPDTLPDEEIEDWDEDDMSDFENELEDETALDTAEKIPTDWTFNSRLVIISNLHEAKINPALWSRCDHFDLHLTQEEYLVRLGMIINDMDIGQKDGIYTEEQAMSAKALVMKVLGPLIEAGNKGIKLYGKHIHLKESLEFRLVKDVADMWLSMIERYMEMHPGATEDEASKANLKKWVRVIVIPRISA